MKISKARLGETLFFVQFGWLETITDPDGKRISETVTYEGEPVSRSTTKDYVPGTDGARQWFLDHTAKYIAERMQSKTLPKVQKPTLAQQRVLTLLGLEVPISREMAKVMLIIAGFHGDGLPKHVRNKMLKMGRHEARKLSDAELLERAKR